eukprot:6275401-Alexandrium_andersonii.AAC.1
MQERSAAPAPPGSESWGFPTFAASEPRRGLFGPLSVLAPRALGRDFLFAVRFHIREPSLSQ